MQPALQAERRRRIAGTFFEVLAEITYITKAAPGSHFADRQFCGLQQIQSLPHPNSQKILMQRNTGVLGKQLTDIIGVIIKLLGKRGIGKRLCVMIVDIVQKPLERAGGALIIAGVGICPAHRSEHHTQQAAQLEITPNGGSSGLLKHILQIRQNRRKVIQQ